MKDAGVADEVSDMTNSATTCSSFTAVAALL
jgi:hypothetical protein